MPAPNTPAEPRGAFVAHFPHDGGLPHIDVGSASASYRFEAHSAFTRVPACLLAELPFLAVLLHRRPQQIRYLLYCSDYYRLEQPCRAGIAPAENRHLFTARVKEQMAVSRRYSLY